MKRKTIACVLFAFCLCNLYAAAYVIPESNRVSKTINTEWVFNYFPNAAKAEKAGYEMPGYDDSQWSYIAVPHTWQTYETTRELHPYIRNAAAKDSPYWWDGLGWYRKRIVIGKEYEGRKICFEFDGVQKYSKIYLNGKYLGDHKGGFTSFYVDASEAVVFGGENILAVCVNNSLNDKHNIPPMNAGNWAVYGGIIRDVRIVVTDKVSVPFQGSYKHEGGTFITTPEVSKKEASVRVKSYVSNDTKQEKAIKVVTIITDRSGKVIGTAESAQKAAPGTIVGFDQNMPKVKNPQLWSPETPYIYNAYTEVYDGKRLADVYSSTFGIRSVAWDYSLHRLVLNGKVTHLHGINRHEEYIWLGQAFPKWIAERDMNDMKHGLEINYMRTAHYPNDPSVYTFMDQNGICINEELPNIKNQAFDPKVQEQNCREMIRRDRNHPSIVIWSMGNETDHACDSQFAWEEDQTRIITVRQPYNESYNPEFCKHTDSEMPVESYLRCTIRGWYDKDDRDLEPDDGQWAGTDYWQHKKSREGKKPISEHNGTVWLYADHGADREYVGAPLKHVNPKGWVDSWRTPKYVYYLWQANFAKKPMVHIQPHFWRSQYLGQKKDFVIDSNCEKVELFVNGKSQGTKSPSVSSDFVVVFSGITIEKGHIEAVGTKKDGTRVIDKVIMAEEPATLAIAATSPTMMSTPDNIIEFKVDIVDKNGVHVYGANNTLRFGIEGPATLVSPEVYISDRDKSEEYEGTMYIDAPVTALIRANGKTGKVTVTVTAVGLEPASTSIEVIPHADPFILSGISEPKLAPEGRKPIQINLSQANFVKAPEEMKHFAGEMNFSADKRDNFRALVLEFIKARNPEVDFASVDFNYVLDAFCSILNSTASFTGNTAYVVADDYNFITDQYNCSRAITKHLYSLNLPESYKQAMAAYYSESIISMGRDKNYIAETELLDKIPSGGIAVYTGKGSGIKGMREIGGITDLKVLLLQIYPELTSWSKDDQKKAYTLISRINPWVNFRSVRDKKDKTKTDTYTVGENRVVLIPDVGSLRNNFPERNL